jgi:tetratricopeptide (TPR) repeat protein
MSQLPTLRIFLSSPGDVAEERALAEIVFRRLADEVGDGAQLSVVIWEHEPLFAHTGFQEQIQRPSECDLVVSILWSRLGMRLPSDFAPQPGAPPPTGTEFELRDALASYHRTGRPNLLIYRKVPGPQIVAGSPEWAERGEQYRRLDEFCREAFLDKDGAVVVAHHTFSDSYDFERRLTEHARRWLDREIQAPKSEDFRPLWRSGSPFRGLQSFEARHQAVFFGRSEALSELVRRLRDMESAAAGEPRARLLLVQGMSGTGKSSLFNAGLLPLLALRPIEGIARWSIVRLRPSESDPTMRERGPLGVLASRLTEELPTIARLGTSVAQLAIALGERPAEAVARTELSLAADAERSGADPARARLILYIDQLEEIFSLPDASATAEPLFNAIVAYARSASVWVAATLRSDFWHRLEAFPALMQCLTRSPPYTLLPPRPDELAEMILEPARAAGLIWEQRGGISLDQELLRDAVKNREALPLLEYTLAELYERREGRLLRWSAYEGGLRGALILSADEAVDVAGDGVETIFRDVMRELVSVGEDGVPTRRYASLGRFPPGSATRALLDRMIARRLCVTTDEGRGDGPVTFLAHETLIRSWPRAQRWLERETALLRLRDELARDAALWEHHGRSDSWLGHAPEKLTAMDQVERTGLMPGGPAPEYTLRSRRRAARNSVIRKTVIAGICLLTALTALGWIGAMRERNDAQKQRDLARSELATAERTKNFMIGLFDEADPVANRGETVTVRQVLDRGATEIENGLENEPVVRADLLTAMGRAYAGLGLYSQAEPLLNRARNDERVSSVASESRVSTLTASGSTAYSAGEYDQAVTFLRAAVDVARRDLPRSSDLRSEALTALADTLVAQGEFSEAIQLCLEALSADRKRGPEDDAVLANTLDSLGTAYVYSGNLVAAEPPLREALNLRTKVFGPNHPRTAESVGNLAAFLYMSGQYDKAVAEYRAELPIYRALYGGDHPEYATALNDLARSLMMVGRIDEAEPLLRQSLSMIEKFGGAQHDELVATLNSLAMIDAFRGRMDAASAEIRRADSIARLRQHSDLLDQVLLNEADIELASGNRAHAAALLAESWTLLCKAYPQTASNTWRYAMWDTVDAELLAAKGDRAGAERKLAAAQVVIRARVGATGFYTLVAQHRDQFIKKAPGAPSES